MIPSVRNSGWLTILWSNHVENTDFTPVRNLFCLKSEPVTPVPDINQSIGRSLSQNFTSCNMYSILHKIYPWTHYTNIDKNSWTYITSLNGRDLFYTQYAYKVFRGYIEQIRKLLAHDPDYFDNLRPTPKRISFDKSRWYIFLPFYKICSDRQVN